MAKRPQTHPPDPDQTHIALPADFWKNARQALFDALHLACVRPSTPQLLWFSIEVKRTNDMANICDVTIGWVDSTSAGVTVQHFASSVQIGSNPANTNKQDLPPTQTSFVVSGVPSGAVVSASVVADNGAVQSDPLTGTFTVPDLTKPLAPSAMTFSVGNVRDDGTTPPPPPPATEAPPAAPAPTTTEPALTPTA